MCEIGSIPKRESWFLSTLDIIGMCLGKPFPAALNDFVNTWFLLNFCRFYFFLFRVRVFLFKRKETRLVVVLGGSKDEAVILYSVVSFQINFQFQKYKCGPKKNRKLEQCLTQRTRREENFILHLPILCKVSVTFELLGTEITTAPSTLQEKKITIQINFDQSNTV